MEIHRRSFDQFGCGKVLRSWEVEDDIVVFDVDRSLRNAHLVDTGVKLIDSLFEVVWIGHLFAILVAQADADSFSA